MRCLRGLEGACSSAPHSVCDLHCEATTARSWGIALYRERVRTVERPNFRRAQGSGQAQRTKSRGRGPEPPEPAGNSAPAPCHLPPAPVIASAVCHGRRLEVIGFATPAARGRSPPCIEASDTLGRLVATGPLSQALRQRTAWSNDGRCRDERRMCRWQLVRASNARARALGRVARELREPPMTIWHPL